MNNCAYLMIDFEMPFIIKDIQNKIKKKNYIF